MSWGEAGIEKAKDYDAALRLRDLMSDISEDCYCAGWLIGLEFTLWRMVQGGRRRFGMGVVMREQIAELRRLSEKTGGWWRWRDGDDGGGNEFLTVVEWVDIFVPENARQEADAAEWKAVHDAKKTDCPKCGKREFYERTGLCASGFGKFEVCDACRHITNGGVILWGDDVDDAP